MSFIQIPLVLNLCLILLIAACGSKQEKELISESPQLDAEYPTDEDTVSSYYLLVTHSIDNLTEWKKEFALMEDRRNNAGLIHVASFTTFLDSSLVCVLFDVSYSSSAMEFAQSGDNIDALNRVGAVSFTDIRIMTAGKALSEIEMNAPFYILVQHPVADYNKWEKIYRNNQDVRAEYNLTELGIFTRPVDSNDVAILMAATSLFYCTAYAELLQSADLMDLAGVSAEPSALVMVPFDAALSVQ